LDDARIRARGKPYYGKAFSAYHALPAMSRFKDPSGAIIGVYSVGYKE